MIGDRRLHNRAARLSQLAVARRARQPDPPLPTPAYMPATMSLVMRWRLLARRARRSRSQRLLRYDFGEHFALSANRSLRPTLEHSALFFACAVVQFHRHKLRAQALDLLPERPTARRKPRRQPRGARSGDRPAGHHPGASTKTRAGEIVPAAVMSMGTSAGASPPARITAL